MTSIPRGDDPPVEHSNFALAAEQFPRRNAKLEYSSPPTARPMAQTAIISDARADGPLVLGIETSCDETGVGIVRGRELLADEVASSMDQHARFGGVVPEVASRAHLEAMVPVLEGAF